MCDLLDWKTVILSSVDAAATIDFLSKLLSCVILAIDMTTITSIGMVTFCVYCVLK